MAFSAVIFLGERPSVAAWVGIFLTVGGVAWVVNERQPRQGLVESKSWGVMLRLLSVLFMTAGIICAKIGVRSVPTVQATLVRMLWGVAGLLCWGCLNRQLRGWVAPLRDPRLLRKISLIVFIVVFGGFWLSLLSLKHLDASARRRARFHGALVHTPHRGYHARGKNLREGRSGDGHGGRRRRPHARPRLMKEEAAFS